METFMLKSMVDFVLEQEETSTIDTEELDWYWMEIKKLDKIRLYAEFLKRPLELWMFVPCDENGNVLQEPKGTDLCSSFFEMQTDYHAEQKYQKAKERVLFEGFEFHSEDYGFMYVSCGDFMQIVYDIEEKTFLIDTNRHNEYVKFIEDLVKYNLTLTNNALKIWVVY